MKWIGQHIWDFISRFRSDVYLENIESGVTVSGGNLGLDSNNKIVKGRQLQVFIASFYDDIGTTKHYIPFKDVNEQTTIYQDEVAMHAVCDGRIVSVSVSPHNVSSAGNLTIGIHTRNVGVSMTASASNWTDQETETLAVDGSGGDDDNHTFHFAFDNAKHFDSTNKVSISIQSDSDLGSTSFWYATVVVEWDWTTFLGSTSAELNSTP